MNIDVAKCRLAFPFVPFPLSHFEAVHLLHQNGGWGVTDLLQLHTPRCICANVKINPHLAHTLRSVPGMYS